MKRSTYQGRTFDWKPRQDLRSLSFGIRKLVESVPTKAMWWAPGPVLDQGSEGACVGFACAGEAAASPVRLRSVSNAFALLWYERAKQLDGWAGEDYEGTSVLAGLKVGKERGFWSSYHWAFDTDDIKRALVKGPVILGIPWYAGMYDTSVIGRVFVSGSLVGGHAILCTGWTPDWKGYGPHFRWRNSWGLDYGTSGNGYISEKDLAYLMGRGGEAGVVTGRALGPVSKARSALHNALDCIRERWRA